MWLDKTESSDGYDYKMAHKSKSEPASGEIKETSIGRTFMIRNDTKEYTPTVKMEQIVNMIPCFFIPKTKIGIFKSNRKTESVK